MRGDGGDNRSADHSTPISLISPYPHISFLYTVRVQIFWLRLCRARSTAKVSCPKPTPETRHPKPGCNGNILRL
jgi:hypothetical protein